MRQIAAIVLLALFGIQCSPKASDMRGQSSDLSEIENSLMSDLAAKGIQLADSNSDAQGTPLAQPPLKTPQPVSNEDVSGGQSGPDAPVEDQEMENPTYPSNPNYPDVYSTDVRRFKGIKIAHCIVSTYQANGSEKRESKRCTFVGHIGSCREVSELVQDTAVSKAFNQLAYLNSSLGFAAARRGYQFANVWTLKTPQYVNTITPFLIDRITLEEECGPRFSRIEPKVIAEDPAVDELSAMDLDPTNKQIYYVDNNYSNRMLKRLKLDNNYPEPVLPIKNAQQIYGMRFTPSGRELALIDTYNNEIQHYKKTLVGMPLSFSGIQKGTMPEIMDIAVNDDLRTFYAISGNFITSPQFDGVNEYSFGYLGKLKSTILSPAVAKWLNPEYGYDRSIVLMKDNGSFATVGTAGDRLQVWDRSGRLKSETAGPVHSLKVQKDNSGRLYVASGQSITRFSADLRTSQNFMVSEKVEACRYLGNALFVINDKGAEGVEITWTEFRGQKASFCRAMLPANCTEEFLCSNEAEPIGPSKDPGNPENPPIEPQPTIVPPAPNPGPEGATKTPDLLFCSKNAVATSWGTSPQHFADCGKVEQTLQYVLCYDNPNYRLECLPYRTGLSFRRLSSYNENTVQFDSIQRIVPSEVNPADHNGCLKLAAYSNTSGLLCIRLKK